MLDASYFISGGLVVGDRRAHEEALVRIYHDELRDLGVEGLSWEQCWDGYRRQAFHGILMTIAASMVVERTERGDDMFMAWLERNGQQVLDLDALRSFRNRAPGVRRRSSLLRRTRGAIGPALRPPGTSPGTSTR